VDGEINLAKLLTAVLAIVLGSFALVNIAVNFQVSQFVLPVKWPSLLTIFKAFTIALPAAQKIFCTIDRVSPLNPESEDGLKLEDVEGRVELQNIKHIYPSRPKVCVMDNVNLVFAAGKTTALVGASGSGKSTIIGLIERFYEPIGGKILIDGHDISTLNLRWMRQQLALVSQEVTTFLNCSFRPFDVFINSSLACHALRRFEGTSFPT
jgi:ATP-binding cassette subfamily B (MDR/TAP) protein 1